VRRSSISPKTRIDFAAEIVRLPTQDPEEVTETQSERSQISEYLAQVGRKGGLKGGKARAKKLSAKRRRDIARKAAKARWGSRVGAIGHKVPTAIPAEERKVPKLRVPNRYKPGLEETGESLEETFHMLAEVWVRETGHISSTIDQVLHPAYQRIIGMGKPVLPLLLRDLKQDPKYWFWALTAITGEQPVRTEDAGNIRKMTQAWLEWGKRRNLI
jgi:hypothetical protein